MPCGQVHTPPAPASGHGVSANLRAPALDTTTPATTTLSAKSKANLFTLPPPPASRPRHGSRHVRPRSGLLRQCEQDELGDADRLLHALALDLRFELDALPGPGRLDRRDANAPADTPTRGDRSRKANAVDAVVDDRPAC